MTKIEAKKYRLAIEAAAESLTDEQALNTPEMFAHWEPNIQLIVDKRIYYNNKLYKVVQAHTSQIGWEPDIAPALFTEVALPGEIPVWKQPTGAQDTYMLGDKVYYPTASDDIYESIIDNNSWTPDVYGWKVI